MKKILLIISLLFLTSCSYFRENYRESNFKMENGTVLHLIMFESTVPLSERSLVVYGNGHPMYGKECEDPEFKNFSNQLWSEIVKQNDLSHLNAGMLTFVQGQNGVTPIFCNFRYSKNKNGEWIMDSITKG